MFAVKTFHSFCSSRKCAGAIALLSCLVLLVYVFYLAPYNNFFYNDMLGYWNRAIDRINGFPFVETQFMAWPPMYHIYLAEFFRLCWWMGYPELIEPETLLVLNCVIFACSVYALHRCAVRWFDKATGWAVVTTAVYAFGFPAWYFNAFLLSENFSAPLLVIAIALIYCRDSRGALIAAAAVFAVAAAARPSIAPYGLAFVIALLVRRQFTREFFIQAAVFSTVFFLLIFLAMGEVARISGGKVKGLSANGGLDFFIANSRYYRIDVRYNGWHNYVIVPALSWKPEQGSFNSTVPYFQQDYYYNLGWQFILHDPARLVKNFEHIGHLFFADMLPSRDDAPGFKFFRPLWDKFKFGLFLLTFLYFWLWPFLKQPQRYFASLLLSILGITLLVSYLFTGEPRYTYSIMFVFYLLGFNAVRLLLAQRAQLRKILPRFALLLATLWGAGEALAYWVEPPQDPHVQMVQLDPPSTGAQELPSLYFPYSKESPLVARRGQVTLAEPARLLFKTELHLAGAARDIRWELFSGWPVRLRVDGNLVTESTERNYFREVVVITPLTAGKHEIELEVDYIPQAGGITVNYVFTDEEGWTYRQILGENRPPVHFSLPEVK